MDLINLGLESLSDKPAPRFTEEELELIELYQCAEQHSKDNAILILRNNQIAKEKEKLA